MWRRSVGEIVFTALLYQLPRYLLVQDFLHRQRDDDGVVGFEEAVYLADRVIRVIERDEEAFVAFAPAHGGLEGVNIGLVHFVDLFYLHGLRTLKSSTYQLCQSGYE